MPCLSDFFFRYTRFSPESPLFPYTTLFRSLHDQVRAAAGQQVLGAARRDLVWWLVPLRAEGREGRPRSEEHTSELQSLRHLVCRLLLDKKDCTHQDR